MLGSFPARGMIRSWLRAGVVENGRLHRTEEGTPQGGVVSPVLLNIALHGMEMAAGVRYSTGKYAGVVMAGCPTVIRYADDLVRHEAPYDRAEVKGLRCGPVAA
ncbi:MAG: reverse transcriptase domain-containing protein, partial [Solirubrobacteraceae bacterium]